MKNFLLSLLLALFSLQAGATHLMGGEILIHDLKNGKHLLTMLIYRDTIGIPMDQFATFHFEGPFNQRFSRTTSYDSVISGNILPMYPYGVEIYLFMDTLSFPSAGHWEVYWEDCCRNAAIQNLTAPLSEKMVLKTSLEVGATPNSTPFFLVPAAIFLPLNTPWQYNPLPFDVDGDSLYWRIDTPLTAANRYCAGYTDPASDPSNPFSIDPVTGTLSWTATNMGNYVASILVEQYRNGQPVGHIRRDMQFIVVNPALGNPFWTSLSQFNLDSLGHYILNMVAGKKYHISLWASHTDSTRTAELAMAAYSEIFMDTSYQAGFQVKRPANLNGIEGVFSWEPAAKHIRNKPYLVTFRVSDGYFTDDKTFKIRVETAVSLEQKRHKEGLKLYPNPADDQLIIEYEQSIGGQVNLGLIDLSGNKVMPDQTWMIKPGVNQLWLQTTKLPEGVYLLHVNNADGPMQTHTVVISH